MRVMTMLGMGATLVLVATGAATAQNVRPEVALGASAAGATSCARFLDMSPAEQDHLVRRMVMMAPASSLSSPVYSPDPQDGQISVIPDTTNEPPLQSGELVSDCQASPPTATLREAFSRANPQLIPQTIGND